MNRERFAWMVSLLLLAVLALKVPGSLAQRDDDYSFVRTLIDINRQITTNYVDKVDEAKLREGAIEGMMGQLDPFSIYIPPAQQKNFDRMLEGSYEGVGIQLDQTDDGKIKVVTPIEGSPAFKAGVLPGDIILKINGESTEDKQLKDIVKNIAGLPGTDVALDVRHATGAEETITLTRQEVEIPTIKGYVRKKDNSWNYFVSSDPKIAYIRITQFTPKTYEDFKSAIDKVMAANMKGLILDLRFNPGGRLDQAVKVIDLLVKQGVIVSTRGRNRPEHIEYAKAKGTLPDFPMIVLVNEHSASAAEIVSGSLKDHHRALVMGTRSYGKGSVQEVMPLEGDSGELKLTVAHYYLPSGRLVQREKGTKDWGVDPQIVIPMTPEQEQAVMKERYEAELMHAPATHTATKSATEPAEATTQPADTQLQRAVETMLGWVVLQQHPVSSTAKVPTTQPQ
jgi:carboxyl-terminal processing protease